MKTQVTILLIGALAITTSCSKDDDSGSSLEGTWNMVHKQGGMAGINVRYGRGTIVWTFDDDSLTIEDGSGNGSRPSCTYSYTTFNKSGKRFLIIDDRESGSFYVRNGALTIDENDPSEGFAADGFMMRFVK